MNRLQQPGLLTGINPILLFPTWSSIVDIHPFSSIITFTSINKTYLTCISRLVVKFLEFKKS
jgi:hypothetical protein